MGGVILFVLFMAVVVILLSPAMRARGKQSRDAVEQAAHQAVVRRLEEHRRRKGGDKDPPGSPEDGTSGQGKE